MDNFLEQLNEERAQLSNKIALLRETINSDRFAAISPPQQELMTLQLSCMETYVGILNARLKDLNATTEDIDWEEWDVTYSSAAVTQSEEHTSGLSVNWIDRFPEDDTSDDL